MQIGSSRTVQSLQGNSTPDLRLGLWFLDLQIRPELNPANILLNFCGIITSGATATADCFGVVITSRVRH